MRAARAPLISSSRIRVRQPGRTSIACVAGVRLAEPPPSGGGSQRRMQRSGELATEHALESCEAGSYEHRIGQSIAPRPAHRGLASVRGSGTTIGWDGCESLHWNGLLSGSLTSCPLRTPRTTDRRSRLRPAGVDLRSGAERPLSWSVSRRWDPRLRPRHRSPGRLHLSHGRVARRPSCHPRA